MFGKLLLPMLAALSCLGQATGNLAGKALDPPGNPVAGAVVTLRSPLTGFSAVAVTGENGEFHFGGLSLQAYRLEVSKPGFAASTRSVAVDSNITVEVTVHLELAGMATAIDVHATDRAELVQPGATGTRTELNAAAFDRLPTIAASRGIEGVLLSFPGFAMDANGAIHPRGAHNQMTYVIDGMPITDQLTGAFANSVDPSIVENIELFTGDVPAEYGAKVSGVANITTRSGIGSARRAFGSTQLYIGSFDTVSQVTQVGGGGQRFGYFASVNTLKSNRFLDAVSLENLHNGGNSERGFLRLDADASPRDRLRFNLLAGRSSFELANLASQHASGQDQRQMLRDASVSVGWLHSIDARSTFDATASYRTAIAQLFPSAGDTPVTAAQARHLTTINAGARFNRLAGHHTLRAGVDFQRFPVSENFSFAITDEEFNVPGSANYVSTLEAYDLTRGGRLFDFAKRVSGLNRSAFAQDRVQWGRLTVSLGLRYDSYRFLVNGTQLQPRLGAALRFGRTVFRASYDRNYQTPPNENLLLASSPEAAMLTPPAVRQALGRGFLPIRPERQNFLEGGVQQAVGNHVSLNLSYYHKSSLDLQDNDNFLNTGIIFPTTLASARVNGAEARLVLLPVRGLSATLSATHYHAIVTPPFTGGLFLGTNALNVLSAGPFVIDHDQTLSVHTALNYSHPSHTWALVSVRYDSGLVSNPSDPAVVAADPDYAALLPYVNLAGAPPRVRSRTVVDMGVGYDRYRGERKVWDISCNLTNATGRTGLYNFQSAFVGTRVIAPFAAGLRLRLHW